MLRPYRITHVTTQYSRVRSCSPRMARAVLPVSVACDDRERTGYRRDHHRLRVRMHHDGTADPSVALKALAIQPLPGGRPFQLGQTLIGSVLVNVLDRGRLNL